MEGYYDTLFKIIQLLGLDFKGASRLRPILLFIAAGLIVAVLQQVLFVFDERNPLVQKLSSIPSVLLPTEGIIKMSVSVINQKRIRKVMDELDGLYHKLTASDRLKVEAVSYRLRRAAYIFGITYFVVVWFYHVFPIIIMTKIKLSTGEWVFLFPFYFWYPFNHRDYYYLIYFYETIIGQISELSLALNDMLYIMILAQFIAQYRQLRNGFSDLIEEIRLANKYEQKHKDTFKLLVEIQSKLNELCDELNDIFKFLLLARLILTSFIICFAGFNIVTQTDPIILFQFWSLITLTLGHTLFLCWLGDMIHEEVILDFFNFLSTFEIFQSFEISNGIYCTKFYEIDQKVQKSLMLVMQRSQMAKTITATEFFTLSCPEFTSVSCDKSKYLN